ncbi:MAG: hypothetical protein ACJ8AW_08985 [Rhodopila sp.]
MVRCREIQPDDLDKVVTLLIEGFSNVRYCNETVWRLGDHRPLPGLPRYGYVLEHDGTLVGVVLLIFTEMHVGGRTHVRCNTSSWYVRPAYRVYASLLAMQASRHRNVTFFNVTPAPTTWPILEALGYTRFAAGLMVALPLLTRTAEPARVGLPGPTICPDSGLGQAEIDLLREHQRFGCLTLICEADGQRFPFVFKVQRRRMFRVARLLYCRDITTLRRFARPIGVFLARRGCLLIKVDSDGPLPGFVGLYLNDRPKYRKGGDQVHPGDLAYSEEAMFSFLA